MSTKKSLLVGIVLLILPFLPGCNDFVDADQPLYIYPGSVALKGNGSVGQSFVARHAGLKGIEIYLTPQQSDTVPLQLHLQDSVNSDSILRQVAITPSTLRGPGYQRFTFPPISNSNGHYYYIRLSAPTEADQIPFKVTSAPSEAYLDGSLYLNQQPQMGQMSFRLVYAPAYIILDLLKSAFKLIWLTAIAAMLFVLPGMALLSLLWRGPKLYWLENIAVSAGMSVALYPLLLLWLYTLGLGWGRVLAWLPATLAGVYFAWQYKVWQWHPKQAVAGLNHFVRRESFWADASLLIVLTLTLTARFFMVSGLDMPLWDDSVNHTVVVQRMLESGGLFSDWKPYAPYRTFSFHFGFHALATVWAWVTGISSAQAVLWVGQIGNVLAVLVLYPLAYRLRGPWAGAMTVLVAGLWLTFPAYYTNWGRYSQLAGLIVLPIATWWFWLSYQHKKASIWPPIVGGALLIAGMALAYYHMLFHFGAFVLAAFLLWLKPKAVKLTWRETFVFVAMNGLAFLFLLPWLVQLSQKIYFWRVSLTQEVSLSAEAFTVSPVWQNILSLANNWSASDALILLLALLLVFWGVGAIALPALWFVLLKLLPALHIFSTPLFDIVQLFTVNISLYIIYALIAGIIFAWFVSLLPQSKTGQVALTLLIALLALWRTPEIVTLTDRGFDLITRPDLRAAEWIKTHIPADAVFLINGIVYTDGYSAVAGDAGGWLPYLTGRAVTIPPQYALLGETAHERGYNEAVNSLVQQLFQTPSTLNLAKQAICNFPYPVTHLYLGQRRGLVAKAITPPPRPMLPARLLLNDPAYRLIYHQDQVMIFEFDRTICQ